MLHTGVVRVGVVVPTYNRAPTTVDRTLASLTSQEGRAADILVVDQNVGPLREAIRRVALQRHARYQWLCPPNVSHARNVGARLLDAEVIAFVDDDIVLDSLALQRAAEVLRRRPDVECIWASVADADIDGLPPLEDSGPPLRRVASIRSDVLIFRGESFRRSGGFDPHLFAFAGAVEDDELLRRLTRRGIDVWLARDVKAVHYAKEPGGCELRSVPLTENERRCVAGLTFAERAHRGGRLGLVGAYRVARSFLVNRDALDRPLRASYLRARQVCRAVTESRSAILPHLSVYKDPDAVDHLATSHVSLGT